jgi:hypothetical protein
MLLPRRLWRSMRPDSGAGRLALHGGQDNRRCPAGCKGLQGLRHAFGGASAWMVAVADDYVTGQKRNMTHEGVPNPVAAV